MNATLLEAQRAIEAGDKQRAYRLLVRVIDESPRGKDAEDAWLWLSTVVDEPAHKRKCLEAVLDLNPRNAMARERLRDLDRASTAAIQPASTVTKLPTTAMRPTADKGSRRMQAVAIITALFVFCGLCSLAMLIAYYPIDRGPRTSGSGLDTVAEPTRPATVPSDDPVDYIEIVEWDYGRSISGTFIEVSGTIKNNHPSRTICRVQLLSKLQDSNRVDMNTDWTYADSSFLRPGASSPFTLMIRDVNGWEWVTIGVRDASFYLCD